MHVKFPFFYYRIAKALSSCSASTGDIISTTERLKQELDLTTQRQEIVSCFLRDYQLSNEEACQQLYWCIFFLALKLNLKASIYLHSTMLLLVNNHHSISTINTDYCTKRWGIEWKFFQGPPSCSRNSCKLQDITKNTSPGIISFPHLF